MLDGIFILPVNLLVANVIHPQSKEFVTGVKTKATCVSKRDDRPVMFRVSNLQQDVTALATVRSRYSLYML